MRRKLLEWRGKAAGDEKLLVARRFQRPVPVVRGKQRIVGDKIMEQIVVGKAKLDKLHKVVAQGNAGKEILVKLGFNDHVKMFEAPGWEGAYYKKGQVFEKRFSVGAFEKIWIDYGDSGKNARIDITLRNNPFIDSMIVATSENDRSYCDISFFPPWSREGHPDKHHSKAFLVNIDQLRDRLVQGGYQTEVEVKERALGKAYVDMHINQGWEKVCLMHLELNKKGAEIGNFSITLPHVNSLMKLFFSV